MKKLFLYAAVLFLAAPCLHCLDISITGGVGNISFDPASEEADGDGAFPGKFYPLGRLNVTQDLTGIFSFSGTLERDPILRNRLSMEAVMQGNRFSLRAGPFLGLFNSENPVQGGVRLGIGLDFPGIVFFRLNGSTTLGRPGSKGDYETLEGEAAFGFWLPHVVNTLSAGGKSYKEWKSGDLSAQDQLIRFQYSADIYSKGFPWVVRVDAGYETLSRLYDGPSVLEEDRYHIIFLGTGITWTFHPGFRLLLGGEVPVYSWGESPLNQNDSIVLFQAYAGFSVSL
jgi:hypothetical protein